MKTIQEMLQELSQCIVTVSGEFRFRTNWKGGGGKVPQPDLDTFDPNVPFCIENVGDVPASVQYNTKNTNIRISKDYKTWNDYTTGTDIELNPKDRVYIKSDYVLDELSTPKFNFTNANGTRLRARGNIASLLYGTGDEYSTKYTIATQYCYDSMFKDCKSLVQAPELPATNLADGCYYSMFSGCASLTRAPELPATILASDCYFHMFKGCTSLTQAPVLPATTLANYCYGYMFNGCTSLTQAPELPVTTLANFCYYFMFSGCKSLTQAPELQATTLADGCYAYMFNGCTSLTQAPELPATTLAGGCYQSMFEGCASLTQAPELPATTLAHYCYYSMFSGCVKINYVKCLATNTSANNCTKDWLSNVSATGTFECDNKKYFTVDSPNGIPVGWSITEINPDVEKPDLDTFDPNVPFCIENVGDVPASVQYNTKNINIRVSKDYKTWNDYTTGDSITLDPTDRVYIKSDYVKDTSYNPHFVFNGDGARLRARGNIASLIYGTNDTYVNKYTSTERYCYCRMFKGCKSLTQAPELPATTLADDCYSSMFSGCASLTQAPELPATTLADDCYNQMFNGCTSLTQTPELPAAILSDNCYSHMFSDCTSLTQAPELPTTTLANYCYYYMFSGCTSLTQAPELPATVLANYCYAYMFSGCTSLTQAPELPATVLANYCYDSMFSGCTSLTQAPMLSATTLAEYCYRHMFANCASLIQAPELPATTLAFNCYNSMFWLCKSLTKAPELPATTLYRRCYSYMFSDCTSLTQAPELTATTLTDYCYYSMFEGCIGLTQAPTLPATTLATSCYESMFNGCKKLNYVKCLATDTSATGCTENWLTNVSATGTFECDNKKYFTIDSPNGIPTGWSITEINPDVEKPDLDTFDPNVPFCIENVGDVPVEIGLCNIGTEAIRAKRSNCKISTDLVTWSDYNILLTQSSADPNISKITLSNKGDRIYIKADVNTAATGSDFTRLTVVNQSTDTKIRAKGNIASLTYGTDDLYKSKYLAIDNRSCYERMFVDCTSLTQAPDLPATTLYISCYERMFQNCANLKQAPELPAATLKTNCYYWMFRSCKTLNYVKCLATDISATGCTTGFLELVASTGDFYTPASTNWTTGEYGIPAGWTRHDIT